MAGFPGGKLPDQAPFAGHKKHPEALDKNPRVSINAGTLTALRENDRELCYQLDIRANPGNSGGPIVNLAGEVIGVLNAGIRTMQSINYAIPARNFKAVLPASLTAAWPGGAPAAGAAQSYEAFQASGTFKLAQ
jgi:S1-C subfamily serine protease